MNDTGRTITIVIALVVGCIVLTLCVAVATVILLALMGPAIGSVYSGITTPVP